MKSNLYKKFNMFLEAMGATDEEYYSMVDNIYADSNELRKLIRMGDEMGKDIADSDIKTEKSDSGNLIIRYIVSEEKKLLIVLGIISKEHKIIREDIDDLKDWLVELEDYFREGYTLMASTNKYSYPFLKKVLKNLDKDGVRYDISKQATPIEFEGTKWENITVRPI